MTADIVPSNSSRTSSPKLSTKASAFSIAALMGEDKNKVEEEEELVGKCLTNYSIVLS